MQEPEVNEPCPTYEGGFIKTFRSKLDWEWFTEPLTAHLFEYLLLAANYKDKRWQGIPVKRGQLITGRQSIAIKTGLTERQVRTSLKRLESTGEITRQATNRFTIITIRNYDTYQHDDRGERPAKRPAKRPANDQQVTSNRPASDQQVTTTEEGKKERRKEERKNTKKKSFDFRQALLDSGVPEQVADDWMEVRRKAKATNTETAFNRLVSEAKKAGWSVADAVTEACSRSWRGFKAEFVAGKGWGGSANSDVPDLSKMHPNQLDAYLREQSRKAAGGVQ